MNTIDHATLVTVTGGNLASSRPQPLGPRDPGMPTLPKPFPGPTFPKPPTIPLGPFYPDQQPRKDIA